MTDKQKVCECRFSSLAFGQHFIGPYVSGARRCKAKFRKIDWLRSISAKDTYLLFLLRSWLLGVGGLGIILGCLGLLLVLLLASKRNPT